MIRQKREPFYRWECRCGEPPILLARYSTDGQIEIKVRDRFYFMASRCVQATCPRCGAQHVLDLRPAVDDDDVPVPVFQPDPGAGWE
jgi:hypothetical protein